jgi:NADPH-dependent 2,4-dienoyl-CoA reductase/sulfur reductase-like enzyme
MAPSFIEPESPEEVFEHPHIAFKAAPPSLSTQKAKKAASEYVIKEEPIRTRRPLRVVCMGAGYSGLMMAIVFSQKLQDSNAEFVVYERNADLGGTWLENRYLPIFTR